MTWASTVPLAIDALVAKLQTLTATDLAGVGLRDGPRVVADGKLETITVGFVTEDDAIAVEHDLEFAGLAIDPLAETYTIRNAVTVVNGAGNVTAARIRAGELLGIVGGVLAADKTLGVPGVLSARLGDLTWLQSQEAGAEAQVLFGVVVQANTQR